MYGFNRSNILLTSIFFMHLCFVWQEAGYEVQFTVYTDDEGRYKCKTVSATDGSPCIIPKRPARKRGKGDKKEKGENKEENEKHNGESAKAEESAASKKPAVAPKKAGREPRKRFDSGFTEEIKEKLKEKKFDMRQTSILVIVDKARVKFGPDGYAALANADGVLAEGKFTCDDKGTVALEWTNMLKYEDDEWKPQDEAAREGLVKSFNWSDGMWYFHCLCMLDQMWNYQLIERAFFLWLLENVTGLKQVETPESLWGEGKKDESEALEKNMFQMRKCFLIKSSGPKKGGRNRPRNRGGKRAGDKKRDENGKGKENGKKEE